MNILIQITEFFQLIYESTKEEVPEFLKHAHEFDVRYALRNLDAPNTPEILAKEDSYRVRLIALRQAYYDVYKLVDSLPEDLKPAALHVAGYRLPVVLEELGLSEHVRDTAISELKTVLAFHATPTDAQLATVLEITQAARSE